MTILIVVPSAIYGGGEVYVENLINANNGREIHLLSACNDLNDRVKSKCTVHSFNKDVVCFNLYKILFLIKINRIVNKYEIESVFLNGLPEIGIYCNYIRARKIFCVGHSNEYWLRCNTLKSKIKKVLLGSYEDKLTKFIAINQEVVKSARYNKKLSQKTVLIYSSVPKVHVKKCKTDNDIVFGRIGRLCDGKGNEFLLDNFKKLSEKYGDVRLLFAGSGILEKELIEKVNSLGLSDKVTFLGQVEKNIFFSKIDIMISPSDFEAFPLVILEAMSCNTPIISTNVGGVSEMITNNESGLLIEPRDDESLLTSMSTLIDNQKLRESLASKGKETYDSKFNFNISIDKIYNLIS
ncbi:TPA: glycosyltransferase family 4 protein [Photobacterium damselae]